MRWSIPLLASLFALPLLAAEPKFTIITDGTPGLREGDKVYRIGMDAGDFRKQFGDPDKEVQIKDVTGLDYISEGVGVSLRAGKIVSISVYLRDENDESPKYRAANAVSDKGIGRDSTYRELVKAHGAPTKKGIIEEDRESPEKMFVNYESKAGVIQFVFVAGKLNRITVSGPP